MSRRFDSLVFPGGKHRAFTLSYDDGVVEDRRLAALCSQYGAKCTFNLNSGFLGRVERVPTPDGGQIDFSKVSAEEVADLYRDHEVGGHSLYHSDLTGVGTPRAMYEILEDKLRLEHLTGRPLSMFAYPFGFTDDKVVGMLRDAGYKGARTVKSTYEFRLPDDFLVWGPTCHHGDERLMELAERFVKMPPLGSPVFYVWGHAYEFEGARNWDIIEGLLRYLQENGSDIWFATNGQIIDYVTAYRRLEYSADGTRVFNPSAVDVILLTDFGKEAILPAGTLTTLEE